MYIMYISDVKEQVPNTIFDCIKISQYQNYCGKVQIGEISLTDLFQEITQAGVELIEDISWARQELQNGRREALDAVKLNLPGITPHGILSPGQKSNDKILTFSNLLFVDIDFKHTGQDPEEIKKLLIERQETVACWTSVSGMGVHSLIACDNIPKEADEFRAYHLQYINRLAEELNLPREWFDNSVCNIQAACAIPFDDKLLVNYTFEPFYLEYEKPLDCALLVYGKKDSFNQAVFSDLIKRESTNFMLEVELVKYPYVAEEGIPYFRAWIPYTKGDAVRRVLEGKRNEFLSTHLNNLIILNPNKTQEDFNFYMIALNQAYCYPPLPKKNIIRTVANKLKNRDKLVPKGKVRLKKIWASAPGTPNRREAYRQVRKDYTMSKIQEFMSSLDKLEKKVSRDSMAAHCKISRETLSRYLTPEMAEQIATHNKQIIKNRKK